MEDANLREDLERLHLELLNLPPGESAIQEKRDDLAKYIREALDGDNLIEYHVSLETVLNEEFVAFELEHPKIAHLMKSVANLLS